MIMNSKKLISWLLAISLSIATFAGTSDRSTIVSVTAYAENTDGCYRVYGDWIYSDNEDGSVAINRFTGTDENIIIPNVINGKTVTKLDGFGGDDVTNNGHYTGVKISAFQDTGIKSVVIPDTVTSMEYQMFDGCNKLESIVFGNNLEEIPDMTCFRNISLKDIEIGSAVKKIGRYAFDECSDLTKLTVPSSVTDIEYRAFGFVDGKVNDRFTVYCTLGSAAYNYAVKNGIKYVLTDEEEPLKVGKVITDGFSSTVSSVSIKWEKVPNASGYRVYKYNPSSKKWKIIKTLSRKNVTSYTISRLKSGTAYYFKIKAFNKTGGNALWGTASNKLTTVTKPQNIKLTAIPVSKTAVKLSWNKVSCTGYTLQKYNISTKKWKNVKTLSYNVKSYKVKNLKKNTMYKFRIRAYKKVGNKVSAFGSWKVKKVRTKR